MTSNYLKTGQTISYDTHTMERAERALSCSPFQLKLLVAMCDASVPLPMIAGDSGKQKNYTKMPLSESRTERELVWLIQVGLLRREVDGQGITDSFRLTPLGRQLLTKWQNQNGALPVASQWQRLSNSLNRWTQLTF